MSDWALQNLRKHVTRHQRKVRNLKLAAVAVAFVAAMVILKWVGCCDGNKSRFLCRAR